MNTYIGYSWLIDYFSIKDLYNNYLLIKTGPSAIFKVYYVDKQLLEILHIMYYIIVNFQIKVTTNDKNL